MINKERSYNSKKTKVFTAAELMDNYYAKSSTLIFEEHINTSTKMYTDKFRDYSR